MNLRCGLRGSTPNAERVVMQGQAYIGTSGWTYDAWKAGFYAGVPRSAWLAHHARHFRAVEVNATFYRRLKQSTFATWLEKTPPDFRFAIKGHRYLTHVKKLAPVGCGYNRYRVRKAARPSRYLLLVLYPAGTARLGQNVHGRGWQRDVTCISTSTIPMRGTRRETRNALPACWPDGAATRCAPAGVERSGT